jgi:chromosome segregation ATPase
MTQPEPEPLRYRRLGGGYRRQEVEASLQRLLTTVSTVEGSIELLRRRTAQLEAELESARAELEAYHTRDEWLEATIRRAEDLLLRAVKD